MRSVAGAARPPSLSSGRRYFCKMKHFFFLFVIAEHYCDGRIIVEVRVYYYISLLFSVGVTYI